jgi:protein phosphatase
MTQTIPPRPEATIPPVAWGALTHPGQVRSVNEDGVFSAPDKGLWAVADGMGGHVGGAEAAALIVKALAGVPHLRALDAALDGVDRAVTGAGRDIAALATRSPGAVIGATMVALVIRGRDWGCLWAGDSRAYRLRGGRLEQLTRDHSEVNDLLAAGVITPAEAETWPRRNVISRAVGVSDPLVLDRVGGVLEPGDVFVLCSDGLMKHVTDAEIATLLAAHPQAGAAAGALIDLTLERGAQDNVTVVVVAAPGIGTGTGPGTGPGNAPAGEARA